MSQLQFPRFPVPEDNTARQYVPVERFPLIMVGLPYCAVYLREETKRGNGSWYLTSHEATRPDRAKSRKWSMPHPFVGPQGFRLHSDFSAQGFDPNYSISLAQIAGGVVIDFLLGATTMHADRILEVSMFVHAGTDALSVTTSTDLVLIQPK